MARPAHTKKSNSETFHGLMLKNRCVLGAPENERGIQKRLLFDLGSEGRHELDPRYVISNS